VCRRIGSGVPRKRFANIFIINEIFNLHAKLSRMARRGNLFRSVTEIDIPVEGIIPKPREIMRRYIWYLSGIEVDIYHQTMSTDSERGIEGHGRIIRCVIHDTIRYRFLIYDPYNRYRRTSLQVHYRDRVCPCKSIP